MVEQAGEDVGLLGDVGGHALPRSVRLGSRDSVLSAVWFGCVGFADPSLVHVTLLALLP
ncbi:hypothetical protein GCM10028833_10660 [Glycomyces tarimensis]